MYNNTRYLDACLFPHACKSILKLHSPPLILLYYAYCIHIYRYVYKPRVVLIYRVHFIQRELDNMRNLYLILSLQLNTTFVPGICIDSLMNSLYDLTVCVCICLCIYINKCTSFACFCCLSSHLAWMELSGK